jgi:hypothetical protein
MTAPSRYSGRPFPEYRYVPGKSPHPTRAPDGHSFGRELEAVVVDDSSWRSCDEYLYAVDLFNHGYYWESHEWFEATWHGAGRTTSIGIFAQGLIQAAAALLKHEMGQTASAERLAVEACTKLRQGPREILGVHAHALADSVAEFVTAEVDEVPTIVLALTDVTKS